MSDSFMRKLYRHLQYKLYKLFMNDTNINNV